eukprot:GHRR01020040.1.p3 GENE.GHRR01020040.1~~GHRR01020040.1.p3  ORF type:complete len:121 (+),score=22.80 GHRR01020040.1:548-910(+)
MEMLDLATGVVCAFIQHVANFGVWCCFKESPLNGWCTAGIVCFHCCLVMKFWHTNRWVDWSTEWLSCTTCALLQSVCATSVPEQARAFATPAQDWWNQLAAAMLVAYCFLASYASIVNLF